MNRSKYYIKKKKIEEEKEKEVMLTKFMENATEAAKAVHVERLVRPKWS